MNNQVVFNKFAVKSGDNWVADSDLLKRTAGYKVTAEDWNSIFLILASQADNNASAILGKQDKLTFDSTPTANSTKPVTSGGVKSALDAKQNKLTFDSTPKANSSNPVTSGGVKTAIDAVDAKFANKQNTIPNADKLHINSYGIIDASNLPSYVDDVIEVYILADGSVSAGQNGWFRTEGTNSYDRLENETGKIYVVVGKIADAGESTGSATDAGEYQNTQWRWTGSQYVKLTDGSGGGVSLSSVYPVGSIYMSVNSTSPATLFGGTWERIQDRFLLAAGSTYAASGTGGEATHNNMPPYLTVYMWKRTAVEPSVPINVTKDFNDWGKADSFIFDLAAVTKNAPMPAKTQAVATKAAPVADFGKITYEKAGTYKYIITEVNDGIDGVSYDTTPHEVVVTVTKDENNRLTATVTYDKKSALEIINTYSSVTTEKPIKVTKSFNDWSKADSFIFDLAAVTENAPMPKDADGKDVTVATATKDAPLAVFGDITFEKAGTYKYTITERNSGADGVSYDVTPHTVTVEVKKADDATNKLTATVKYDSTKDDLTVTNTYTAAYAVFDSSDGSFTFFRDAKGKYTDGQVDGTKTYYTGFEDITGKTAPSWFDSDNYKQKNTIKTVVFKDKIKPKTCYDWFSNAKSLTSITGLDKLDTSAVTDMSHMFPYCSSLTDLDLSSFNTAKVTDMCGMFFYCFSLTNLDLSSFNTAKVTDMSYMFQHCSSLTNLDLSSFNTAAVTNMMYMFRDCDGLKTIYASSLFTTNAVGSSSGMFRNCASIVGGAGTKYNPSNEDKTYARIDGGTSRRGYFTAKAVPA